MVMDMIGFNTSAKDDCFYVFGVLCLGKVQRVLSVAVVIPICKK